MTDASPYRYKCLCCDDPLVIPSIKEDATMDIDWVISQFKLCKKHIKELDEIKKVHPYKSDAS